MNAPRNVALLLFDDVEVLDFAGPFEVFSVTGRDRASAPFNVYTCAEKTDPIWTRGGLSVNARHPLNNCPPPDILIVPGGWGTRQQMNHEPMIAWIKEVASRAELVLSVCTGALLLAKAGLLDGLDATTHHAALDLLAQTAPRAAVRPNERWIDNGRVITAAGISAGIDASLHLVGRLLGAATAAETARYMEYDWKAGG